jgi:hypothetical protein
MGVYMPFLDSSQLYLIMIPPHQQRQQVDPGDELFPSSDSATSSDNLEADAADPHGSEDQEEELKDDLIVAGRVVRRLLDQTKDQAQTRQAVYRQHTASTFLKICKLFSIPINPGDTKFTLYNSLTTSVTFILPLRN